MKSVLKFSPQAGGELEGGGFEWTHVNPLLTSPKFGGGIKEFCKRLDFLIFFMSFIDRRIGLSSAFAIGWRFADPG